VFSIRFREARFKPEFSGGTAGTSYRFIESVIGEYENCILAQLSFWTESDYQAQWREGAERLLNGAEKSCLVTYMGDPADENQTVHFYELHRMEGNSVGVLSSMCFAPSQGGPLDPGSIYDVVPPYAASDDGEGLPPLEWRIQRADLVDWLSAVPA
jgi:CdiI N-terminal domain